MCWSTSSRRPYRSSSARTWPTYRDVLNQSGAPSGNSSTFETIDIDASIAHLASLPALRKMPLVVLSKTQPFALGPDAPAVVSNNLERIWLQGQSEVVGLEPNTPHISATGSDHYVQVRDPDLVISAVHLVSARIKG